MSTTRIYTITIPVTVPAVEGEDFPAPEAVARVVTAALQYDIDPDVWGEWQVGEAQS